MNKLELVSVLAEKSALTKKDCETVLKAFMETVGETLAKGEKIQLIGFGTFESKDRAQREGVNPKTREKITIPACKVPSFKAGRELKAKLNNK